MKRRRLDVAIALGLVVAAGVAVAVLATRGTDAGTGGATAASTVDALAQELERRLGADSCTDAGFALESGADGSRSAVYDCAFGNRRRCITVDRGLARDATADVERLFANVRGHTPPECAR